MRERILGVEGAPAILQRRRLAEFYGIPATTARTVADLTPTEIAEAWVVMDVESALAAGPAAADVEMPEPEPD